MADHSSAAQYRLTQAANILTGNKTASGLPWDPSSTVFPSRKEVQRREGKLHCCIIAI